MKRIPPKVQPWFDARRTLGLSHASIQMARELGMDPKKLRRLVPARGEQWKTPLPEFIAHCYEKAHGRSIPEKIRSLEQIIEYEEKRKEARRERKAIMKESVGPGGAGDTALAETSETSGSNSNFLE